MWYPQLLRRRAWKLSETVIAVNVSKTWNTFWWSSFDFVHLSVPKFDSNFKNQCDSAEYFCLTCNFIKNLGISGRILAQWTLRMTSSSIVQKRANDSGPSPLKKCFKIADSCQGAVKVGNGGLEGVTSLFFRSHYLLSRSGCFPDLIFF